MIFLSVGLTGHSEVQSGPLTAGGGSHEYPLVGPCGLNQEVEKDHSVLPLRSCVATDMLITSPESLFP